MASTQYTFPGPGDRLDGLGVVPVPLTIANSFNVSYDKTGNPTNVSGNLSVNAFGSIKALTFNNYAVSFNKTTGVYTVTADALGGLGKLKMTYTGQNPSSVNVQISTAKVLGCKIPLLSNPHAAVHVTPNVPCFAAGTLIRTSRGEVAVEDLRVGDSVETTSGRSRPIVWLGNTEINTRIVAHPIAYQPIRIAADAFGPGMPYDNLTVSPGHGLCVRLIDEVIVPPVVLLNGTTVTQLDVDHISYWHVELDAHDILYANGLPAESYIDVGNRNFFSGGEGDVDPTRTPAVLADYCRPYVAEGALVTALCGQLQQRAETLGWRRETSPFAGLHLEVDGTRIEPQIKGLTARFELPVDATEVWLTSAACVPAEVMESHDMRRLGILLWGLRIEDGAGAREIAIDDPSLCVGFHKVEAAEDGGPQRWTTGRARLPAALWKGSEGALAIRIELASPPLVKWVAPPKTKPSRADGRHLSLVASA